MAFGPHSLNLTEEQKARIRQGEVIPFTPIQKIRSRIGIHRARGQVNVCCYFFILAFRRGFFAIGPFGFKPAWFHVGAYR